MTEFAFLRAFLGWETFLEESFILYLLGSKAPRGRAPHRYAFPPSQNAAAEWILPERSDFANWTDAAAVSKRAERFFRVGGPFAAVLRANQNALFEARALRNAVAHASMSAQQKFEAIVRTKLGTVPANITVGGFLTTTMPGSSSPASFLEFYLSKIEFAAQQIVPT